MTGLSLAVEVRVKLFLISVYKSRFVPSALNSSSSSHSHTTPGFASHHHHDPRPLSTTMSNPSDPRPNPVIPVLVPWLRGQPSRRPYVVMRRAEEHYRELLVFLHDMAKKAEEPNMAPATTCHVGFAHSKVMIVASSVAELKAVRNKAIKADIAGRLEFLNGDFARTRHMLKM